MIFDSRHGSGGCDRIVSWRIALYLAVFEIRYSEMTPQGRKATKLSSTLLNGNNICMV